MPSAAQAPSLFLPPGSDSSFDQLVSDSQHSEIPSHADKASQSSFLKGIIPSFYRSPSSQASAPTAAGQPKRRDTIGHSLSQLSQSYMERRGDRSRTSSFLTSNNPKADVSRTSLAEHSSDSSESSSDDDEEDGDGDGGVNGASPSIGSEGKRAGSAVKKPRKSLQMLWSQS
jgi:hypothetical protein